METVDWRRLYGLRPGAEGGIEEFADGHRGRRCRHRGLAKAHVQRVLTALAINVERQSGCWTLSYDVLNFLMGMGTPRAVRCAPTTLPGLPGCRPAGLSAYRAAARPVAGGRPDLGPALRRAAR
nr:transposase [Streptomyces sp. NBC_00974]